MNKTSISLLALALGSAMSASATPIFSDDFDRGVSTSVGNGWTEVEGTGASAAADVSLVNRTASGLVIGQQMQLRDNDPQAIASQLSGISTAGYTNIALAYDWAPTNNTESGDFLWVEWRNGSGGLWTGIAHHALLGPAAHTGESMAIAGAGGLADFELRFRVAVDANNEGAYVDNVSLSGVSTAPGIANDVPEPGSFALAGLGLGLAAFLGRRKALVR
jgi:PEP-CTERM motif